MSVKCVQDTPTTLRNHTCFQVSKSQEATCCRHRYNRNMYRMHLLGYIRTTFVYGLLSFKHFLSSKW